MAKKQDQFQKLIKKRDELEDKLFAEQCRLHEMLNNRGWGYGMRCVKLSFSTKKEDNLKTRIEKINKQIVELSNK